MIFSLLLFIHSISASFYTGGVMPDGKVDKVVESPQQWHGPVWGADMRLAFAPDWYALHQWNNATVGLGLGYWNMGHQKLGHAITPYIYMDVPLVRLEHFELGLRPAIGAAFMTKTYRNTIPDGHMFVDVVDANQCIGSVTNLYFPEAVYVNFPIAKGWSVSLAAGWYHISNGSTRQPNSGYNIFGGEVSVGYRPQSTSSSLSEPKKHQTDSLKKRWSVSVGATAGGRQVYYRDQQTFAVASMHLAAYWHAHPIFRLGGGVDVFYDGAYIQRETYFGKTNLAAAQPGDCWRVGLSIQPEFIVGDFTAGLHVGAYMYDPIKELEPKQDAEKSSTGRIDKPIFYAYDLLKAGSAGYPDGWLYTELVLRYHLPWNIFVQGIMKSHLTKVEFISLGLGFYY
jgi:hypothetical protein